jgi:phosphoglycolate phosphatase
MSLWDSWGAIHTMPIRAILFDKDGTLVDFQRTWGPATHEVLSRLCDGDRSAFERVAAVSLYDAAARKLLPGSPVVIETTYGYGKLWAEALGRPLTAEFVAEIDRMYFQATLDSLTAMGDVKALLGGLAARGLRLGLMTNDADANTRAQLERLGIAGLLEFVAAYDSGFGAKPAPDPVLAFAKFAGVAPAEIAVVGDTVHDLAAARAAGALAVGVLSGPTDGKLLAPLADVLLPSIAELDAWLRRNAA